MIQIQSAKAMQFRFQAIPVTLSFLLVLCAFQSALPQSCNPPAWASDPSVTTSDNYWVGQGKGKSPQEATASAWSHVFSQLAISHSTKIYAELMDVQVQEYDSLRESVLSKVKADGYFYNPTGQKLFKIVSSEQTMKPCADGFFHHYLLLCTPQKNCKCQRTPEGNAGSIVRSLVLPGWGQFHKDQNKRGLILLSGELLAAAGVLGFNELVEQMNTRAQNAVLVSDKVRYSNLATTYYNATLVSLGMGAGIYVANILDAALNKNHKFIYAQYRDGGISICLNWSLGQP